MLLLLLNLLQSQTRLSKVVIVAAALVLIAGVSLLVYFYRRYKRSEKEPEDDWELSRSSLFVNAPSAEQKTEQAASKTSEASAEAPERPAAEIAGTREFVSDAKLPQPSEANQLVEIPSPEPRAEPVEPPLTQMLASPSKEPAAELKAESGDEATVFDKEVLAGLEESEQPTMMFESQPIASDPIPPPPEPPRSARVDQPSHREPFEPPRIEPLKPREHEATTLRMISPVLPGTQANKERNDTAPLSSVSPGAPEAPLPPEPVRVMPQPVAEWSAASSTRMPEPSAAGRAYRAPAGSVLGIPAEASSKPLILGNPARPAEETGIGALTNYGKDQGPSGGRGGTVALLVVLLLLGGALALYFFVPSIHARVNDWVANIRGKRASAPQLRAQVIPAYRPKLNKNGMVTWEVPVDNITNDPIENLTAEISLLRAGDAPPELRTVSATPNPLPPGQRGTFEFEYDGKRETGFIGYRVTKLFSNGVEIRFSTPGK